MHYPFQAIVVKCHVQEGYKCHDRDANLLLTTPELGSSELDHSATTDLEYGLFLIIHCTISLSFILFVVYFGWCPQPVMVLHRVLSCIAVNSSAVSSSSRSIIFCVHVLVPSDWVLMQTPRSYYSAQQITFHSILQSLHTALLLSIAVPSQYLGQSWACMCRCHTTP